LVDKTEGGISIDECALINKRLGEILDERDIIAEWVNEDQAARAAIPESLC
jgi:ribosome maturation factor RimP